ncbi:hypothetical protein KC19_2G096600 [Ceratodon purpureus]|uniref:Uncharacterized protein n=1 Tax=Ceratodon purpureus TaxID=3225 RepID=A0A8T0IVX5_CERPU|nr:hypothetical protein KC19_2G096600 [Ceratodon purpureus]
METTQLPSAVHLLCCASNVGAWKGQRWGLGRQRASATGPGGIRHHYCPPKAPKPRSLRVTELG